jgi:hypothetical protein
MNDEAIKAARRAAKDLEEKLAEGARHQMARTPAAEEVALVLPYLRHLEAGPASSVLVGEGAAEVFDGLRQRFSSDDLQDELGRGIGALRAHGEVKASQAVEYLCKMVADALDTRPAPLSLLGSGDAAGVWKQLEDKLLAMRSSPPEHDEWSRGRGVGLREALVLVREMSALVAASTGGGAPASAQMSTQQLRDELRAVLTTQDPPPGFASLRSYLLGRGEEMMSHLYHPDPAAAPQHLVVEGAAATREKELSDTLFEVRERLLNHSQQEEAHLIAVDLPELINLAIGPVPQRPARFTQEPNLTELPF